MKVGHALPAVMRQTQGDKNQVKVWIAQGQSRDFIQHMKTRKSSFCFLKASFWLLLLVVYYYYYFFLT